MVKQLALGAFTAVALWLAPATASATCECSGTGIDGPVTIACGGSVCGTDSMTYSCSASGFAPTGQSCNSACNCSGTGLSGPVTVNCGGTVCGTDSMTYSCSASGFSPTGQSCGAGCTCSGTGLSGPVTVDCGGTVCGTDSMTYSCSASGFSPTGQSCGASCTCSGTGLNGPATVDCGQTLCGTDSMTYSCSASGFSPTGQSCGASCTCSGTGLSGPVTVNCGGTVCGTDSMTYSCSASGFSPTGQSCGAPCTCSGTGLNGPTTVDCGQTVCGTDSMTYSCSASGFSPTGQSCGPSCTCSNGAISVNCGESTCGADGFGYVCTADGFWYSGDTCGAEFCNECPHGLVHHAKVVLSQVVNICVDAVDPSHQCGGLGSCPTSTTTIWGCQGPGVCAKESCVAGYGDCDGVASNGCETPVDTVTNCGACGHSCQAGQWCVDGACAATCDPPHTACNSTTGVCANLATSVAHCGSCTPSSACGTSSSSQIPSCSAGKCGGTCAPGFVLVGSACMFATTACANGNAPVGGLGGCDGATPIAICHPPSVHCGTACVDTRIDPNNCGACGSTCAGTCVNGTCQADGADTLAVIPTGQTVRPWLGVDDTYVYAAAGNLLYAALKDGSGAITQITTASSVSADPSAPGDGFVYWSDNLAAGLYRAPVTGGAPMLVAAASTAGRLTLDGGYVYWDDSGTHSIRRAPKDGSGAPAVVVSYPAQGALRGLVVLGNNVYFSASNDGISAFLFHAPKAGGAYTQDVTEARTGGELVVAGGDVYYGFASNQGGGEVRRFSASTWSSQIPFGLNGMFGMDDSVATRLTLGTQRTFSCDNLWYPLVDSPLAADSTYIYAQHGTSSGTRIRRYPR